MLNAWFLGRINWLFSIVVNNSRLGNKELSKYKYLCSHYTDEASNDDPEPHNYYEYDEEISSTALPKAGRKYYK